MEAGARQIEAERRIRDVLPEFGKTEELRKNQQETKRVKEHGIRTY